MQLLFDFFPVIPTEHNDALFRAIIGDIHVLPRDTVDPVVLSARIILDLQTIVSREVNPIDPCVITVGSIHGGTKHNIIPNEVRLQLTVRTTKTEVRDHVVDPDGDLAADGLGA